MNDANAAYKEAPPPLRTRRLCCIANNSPSAEQIGESVVYIREDDVRQRRRPVCDRRAVGSKS